MRVLVRTAALILAASMLSIGSYALSDNLAPILGDKQLYTVQNVPVWGCVEQYDPDGDPVKLSIVQESKKGMVTLYDTTFVYRPYADEMGDDVFTIVAADTAGNFSRQAAITVQIQPNKMGAGFSDMRLHPSHYSALMLAQSGVVSGEMVGETLLFRPEQQLSQADFMIMVLAAVGTQEELAPCVSTSLANDKEIALWLKPYLQSAKQKGLIGAGEFHANRIITRSEAVELISRASGMEDVEAQAMHIRDLEQIPPTSLQSYLNLAALNMLNLYDGNARPNEPLTRAAAADLIWQLYRYRQEQAALKP